MLTDADLEMRELAEAGRNAANGVCSLCEDVLNPLDPRWNGHTFPRTRMLDGTYRETTAAEYAKSVGPVAEGLPYHQYCLEDVR